MHVERLITTIDAHAAGEPLRIITGGLPPLPGDSILARRQAMRERHDAVRRALLWEPRGHADMYGAVLTPPVTPDADYGVIFLTNEGYSDMCGHGVIALTAALIEIGTIAAREPETCVTYDAPAGLIRARAQVAAGRVQAVTFANVPAFRLATAFEISVDGRPIPVDIAFGGAWYALVEAADLAVSVERSQVSKLIQLGMAVKRAVNAALPVVHPAEPELAGIYGTIISAPPQTTGNHGRNVTIYADGAVDRSPCGTGTSAKLACRYADGTQTRDEPYVHESIIDTRFTGRVVAATSVGPYPAVETEITGQGFITGFHQFVIDPADPTREGFLVR